MRFLVTGGAGFIGSHLTQLQQSLQNCSPQWSTHTRYAPAKAGDIQESKADISKARLYLGFEPQYSLRDGLISFCASLNNSLNEHLNEQLNSVGTGVRRSG